MLASNPEISSGHNLNNGVPGPSPSLIMGNASLTMECALEVEPLEVLDFEKNDASEGPLQSFKPPPKSKKACFDYQKGICFRGANCRFTHLMSEEMELERKLNRIHGRVSQRVSKDDGIKSKKKTRRGGKKKVGRNMERGRVCSFFLKGKCTKTDCKFRHEFISDSMLSNSDDPAVYGTNKLDEMGREDYTVYCAAESGVSRENRSKDAINSTQSKGSIVTKSSSSCSRSSSDNMWGREEIEVRLESLYELRPASLVGVWDTPTHHPSGVERHEHKGGITRWYQYPTRQSPPPGQPPHPQLRQPPPLRQPSPHHYHPQPLLPPPQPLPPPPQPYYHSGTRGPQAAASLLPGLWRPPSPKNTLKPAHMKHY